MSGHNKWSKIKHKKAISDSKKSKEFSKLARLLTVESKKASGDISSPSLRVAIEKARGANMPSINIDRAVKKGITADAASMEAITYEAYGPGGSALVIEALTENKNKAASEIKHILSKNGSSLAAQGSATWAFEKITEGWKAKTPMAIPEGERKKLVSLIEELEDTDEVQDVYTNAVIAG